MRNERSCAVIVITRRVRKPQCFNSVRSGYLGGAFRVNWSLSYIFLQPGWHTAHICWAPCVAVIWTLDWNCLGIAQELHFALSPEWWQGSTYCYAPTLSQRSYSHARKNWHSWCLRRSLSLWIPKYEYIYPLWWIFWYVSFLRHRYKHGKTYKCNLLHV